jgi:hypothetical protein
MVKARFSMAEYKFFGVHDGPSQVLEGIELINAGGRQQRLTRGPLFGGRIATERGPLQLADYRFGRVVFANQ